MSRFMFAAHAGSIARTVVSLGLCALATGLLCAAAQADIYKWIDEDGVTYFSERKPRVQTPVETIARDPAAEPEPITADTPDAATPPAPPPAPKVCDGETGATVVGTLVMLLNRAYLASVPGYVADNAPVIETDEYFVCLEAILQTAPRHEQVTGGETGTPSPDAPLAVLLEVSANLADAIRGLNAGSTDGWQTIANHLQTRRPRLEADVSTLTQLIRSVIADVQANPGAAGVPAGTL